MMGREKDFWKIMNKYKIPIILVLIILLASILRFWKIADIPPGLFGDEVDTGYQAYSILRTGRDYFGNLFPVHFQSFGDWRVPLYIYFDTLFVAAFGLTELAVRLPSAILGILGVLVVYVLAKKITHHEGVSLLSAFLLSISPWHLQISRIALEAIFLPVLFPLGLIAFLKGTEEKKKNIWLALSGLLLGLTVYSYSTPKLFLPLLVLVLVALWRKEFLLQKKKLLIFTITIFVVLLPLIFDFLKGSGQARFLTISIFSDQTVAERVRILRENCDFPTWQARILHNKVTVWLDIFAKNYLSSISTTFLFAQGDLNPRHSVGERGELYLFELPFLILGFLIICLKAFKEKEKIYQLILVWLFFSPIPAALTQQGGTHAIRLFLFIPWLQILIALGIVNVWYYLRSYLRSKRIKVLFGGSLALIVVLSLFSYLHQYFVHYPKKSGRWWNYGYREIFDDVNQVESKYQRIYISPSWEPSIVYTLFYSRYPPDLVQQEINTSSVDIGKYHFLSPDIGRLKRGEGESRTLYVLNPAELDIGNLKLKDNPNFRLIKEIKAPDGSISFVVFSSSDVQ